MKNFTKSIANVTMLTVILFLFQSCSKDALGSNGPVTQDATYVYFTVNPTNGKTLDENGAFEDANGDNRPDLSSNAQTPFTKYDYNYSRVIVTAYLCYVNELTGAVNKTLKTTKVAVKINSNLPIGVPILIEGTGTLYANEANGIGNPLTAVIDVNPITTTRWITSNW